MRKLVAYSISLLLLGLFSSCVVAEEEDLSAQEECGFLKEEFLFKHLYGLCIAYQNADLDGKEDIIQLWDKRVSKLVLPDEISTPEMPNRLPTWTTDCPCWDSPESLADLTYGYPGIFCIHSEAYDEVNYDVGGISPGIVFAGTGLYAAPFECGINFPGITVLKGITSEQADTCKLAVQALQQSLDAENNPIFPECP